jgi:hypothetical protein
MTELALRIALLAALLAIALLVSRWASRRRGRVTVTSLPPGITVVTGPHCRLCGLALDAIRFALPDLTPHVIEGPRALLEDLRIRSLPTVLVVNEEGEVLARRNGHAAVREARSLGEAARRLGEAR